MRVRRLLALLVLTLVALLAVVSPAGASSAPISGAGSSWAANALDLWRRNVVQYGLNVDYSPTGSSDGRGRFAAGSTDFAITELSYSQANGSGGPAEPLPSRGYTYVPLVAGPLAIAYNLHGRDGRRLTTVRLSSRTLTMMFTNRIVRWDDPALRADNPGLDLPSTPVTAVVRSDASHTSFALTTYLAGEQPEMWRTYCAAVEPAGGCGANALFPFGAGDQRQGQGSAGVAGFVAQSTGEGSITYVELGYTRGVDLPMADLANASGRYTAPEPLAGALAVRSGGFAASSDPEQRVADLRIIQASPDPRAYPLSDLAYAVVPTSPGSLSVGKGETLSRLLAYAVCEGQQTASVLAYAPLPRPAVVAALREIARIPGAVTPSIADCANPTLGPGGSDRFGPTPGPAAVLPEVQTPLLLLVGAGLVGVVVLRRRRTVSACATTASPSAPR